MTSLLNRLFKNAKTEAPIAITLQENRLHQRYSLENFGLLTIEWTDGSLCALKDLSYGGFALVSTTQQPESDQQGFIDGFLCLQGERCAFKARKVREDQAIVGFQFVHEDDTTLKFLRPFLENIRCGSTLSAIDPSYLSEQFRQRYKIALRGEGPIDLFLDDPPIGIPDFHMTFRIQKFYHEIRLHEQILATGRSFDEDGTASRMTADSFPDAAVLLKAEQILFGALLQNGPHSYLVKLVYERMQQQIQNPM